MAPALFEELIFGFFFSNLKHSNFKCETFILPKSHSVPYPISMYKSVTSFALIHSDMYGSFPIATLSNHHRFVIFVNDYTQLTWRYLLKHKDKFFSIFQSFHSMVQTQFFVKIQILRSNNYGESVNRGFQTYF